MLGVILFPLVFIIFAIMYMFRGDPLTQNEASDFVNKFIQEFDKEIKEFLQITNYPTIIVNNEDNINSRGRFTYNIDNPYNLIDPEWDSSETMLNIINKHLIEQNLKVEEIEIYFNIINKYTFLKLRISSKYSIISTLIHELTHYKQYLTYNSAIYDKNKYKYSYSEDPSEIEAREYSKMFMNKNIKEIFKFIIKN